MMVIALGAMQMPSNFRYRDVFLKGMPVHDVWDSFRVKHPAMPASRWAKIFSPFDALKGFDEAISSKEKIPVHRPELDEYEKQQLDQKLSILQNYTYNSRMARANRIMVTVSSFQASENYDMGKYVDTAGMVQSVDEIRQTLTLQTADGRSDIDFEDILEIRPQKADLFDNAPDWDEA